MIKTKRRHVRFVRRVGKERMRHISKSVRQTDITLDMDHCVRTTHHTTLKYHYKHKQLLNNQPVDDRNSRTLELEFVR